MALRQRKSKRNLSLCNKEIANHPSVSVTTRSNLPNSRSRRCTQRISDNSAIEDASTSISMSAEHSVQDITAFETSQLRSKRHRVLQKDTPTVTNSGQASYQRTREAINQEYVDLGDKIFECHHCHALFWLNESLKETNKNKPPTFTLCCEQGKVKIPSSRPTPPILNELLDPRKGPDSSLFRQNIRIYNSMFCFTSMGAKIDHTVNDGSSPYIFKIDHFNILINIRKSFFAILLCFLIRFFNFFCNITPSYCD